MDPKLIRSKSKSLNVMKRLFKRRSHRYKFKRIINFEMKITMLNLTEDMKRRIKDLNKETKNLEDCLQRNKERRNRDCKMKKVQMKRSMISSQVMNDIIVILCFSATLILRETCRRPRVPAGCVLQSLDRTLLRR